MTTAPEPPAHAYEFRPGLLRALGRPEAVAIVVGNVIGSGIFAKPGAIAVQLGDFRLILLAWLVGGGLCVLGALCFAELAAMLPRAGGLYVYLREAYGPLPAFLMGWTDFLFSRPGSIGALAVFFTTTLATLLPEGVVLNTFWALVVPISVILGLAFVNIAGVVWGGRVQDWTTLVKAGFVLFVAVLPFVMGGFSVESLTSRAPAKSEAVSVNFAMALLAVMWAYNGWHGVTPVAEEIRDPQRNLPFALFTGIGILIFLYVSANIAYHSVLSMEEVQQAGRTDQSVAPLAVTRLIGPIGGGVMAVALMCSAFGALNSNLLVGPRVAFALGRDRVFFPQLGRVHVTNQTPSVAISIQAMMAVGLVVASHFLVQHVAYFKSKSIFDVLTDFVIFGMSVFYALSAAAVIVLRIKHPEWPRPYKTLGYPFVPVFFVGIYVWFLWQVYHQNPFESRAGLALIALGVPVFLLFWLWGRAQAATALLRDDDEPDPTAPAKTQT